MCSDIAPCTATYYVLFLFIIGVTLRPSTVNGTLIEEPKGLEYGTPKCGRPIARHQRIVGGDTTYDGEFPWLVSIQLSPTMGENKCGGSILNDRWILTAAHCFYGYDASLFVVRVADYNLRRKEGRRYTARTFRVDRVITHPKYRQVKVYDNDIALVRLASPIQFNPYAIPACLPSLKFSTPSGTNVTIVGWGQLGEGQNKLPETPKKATLALLENQTCNEWLKNRDMRVLDTHVCAGLEKGGRDACQGDSGGPLMAREEGRFMVLGVVSAGFGCARQRTPGIYTRVSSYVNWIQENIATR